MNDLPGDITGRRRRFGLKSQLLLLLFTLNLVAATAYSVVLYNIDRREIMAGIDGRLRTAVLAVRLALLRGLSRLDMAFFDEPTQNMDGERRGNLAEQIRRVRGFEQLVVISHDDTFEQGLDSVIHLDKRNGETVLLEDDAFAFA